ncbi:MAG: YkgJ family cysteine cluster protein [Pseudomonadota bacterium]
MGTPLTRQSEFSYRCAGCGQCCHHKRIQVGAYEIYRLARNRGMSTSEFLDHYLMPDTPYLRFDTDGACPFLMTGRCDVYADRPLVCRLYPLGRHVDPNGNETFTPLAPHPRSEGRLGGAGTVAAHLEQQGALPYLIMSDQYLDLFHELHAALQATTMGQRPRSDGHRHAQVPMSLNGITTFREMLDIDFVLERNPYIGAIPLSLSAEKAAEHHLKAIRTRLTFTGGGSP